MERLENIVKELRGPGYLGPRPWVTEIGTKGPRHQRALEFPCPKHSFSRERQAEMQPLEVLTEVLLPCFLQLGYRQHIQVPRCPMGNLQHAALQDCAHRVQYL